MRFIIARRCRDIFHHQHLQANSNKLVTDCSTIDLSQYTTKYESYWNSRKSCIDSSTQVCPVGEYLPKYQSACKPCAENNYCTGGTFEFNKTTDQGITACASGLYAPQGMSSSDSCGRMLHVGDNVVYLRSVKKTDPALYVQIGNDIFYGNMTTASTNMNSETEQQFKLNVDNTTYSVYDDTVTVAESTPEPAPAP